MVLGQQPPFSGYGPREHAPYDYERNWRYWPKPYARLFERIGYRRYTPCKPWSPGRYSTAAWRSYGRFSGLRQMMRGQYYAARYTGEHITPDHYVLDHHGEEAYRRHVEGWRRKASWRLAA